MIDYSKRLAAVQKSMAESHIDLMFLPYSANLHYVTGIAREEQNYGNTIYPGDWMTGAWIAPNHSPILTVPRMTADFHSTGALSAYDVRVLPDAGDPAALVRDVLAALDVPAKANLAIESRARAETVMKIQSLRPEAAFSNATDIMAPLRVIKDAEELAILRKAGEITEAAYAAARQNMRHGMSTLDLITEVNYQLKVHGSYSPSFVTTFYNIGRAFPFDFHNHEAILPLPLNPPVCILFDFGSVFDGYCYDYGRTVFFGEPDAEYLRVYELVMASQAAGIKALKAGNTCEQVDAIARAVIADAGYGDAFRHRLGHGIGMDVHEPPFLAKGNTTELRPGMCFTIEPSIIRVHQVAARVEDIIVVGADGGIPLTTGYQAMDVLA